MSDATILSLEVLQAKKGDCLLLHYGTQDNRKLWVIDGGPSQVYRPALRKRLNALRGDAPLEIELLMISHHDDDHIKGILDMCEDLDNAAGARPYMIHNLWHNSFQDLVGLDPAKEGAIPDAVTAAFGAASPHDRAMLASVGQGHSLGAYARKFGWPVNSAFAGKIASFGQDPAPDVSRFAPLAITIVGPMQGEIDALRAVYRDYLEKLGRDRPDEAEAVLAAYKDKSPANLSSIVALVEHGGKSILLTGDARGDTMLAALRELGLIGDGKVLRVDVLKLPHHGSDNNVEPDFFENIHADHYVFCGDGSHGNPERGTLQMLFDARETAPMTLHFNYALSAIDAKRASEWAKKKTEPWDLGRRGLATFLGAQRKAGRNFTVIEPGEGRERLMIDLFGPVTV